MYHSKSIYSVHKKTAKNSLKTCIVLRTAALLYLFGKSFNLLNCKEREMSLAVFSEKFMEPSSKIEEKLLRTWGKLLFQNLCIINTAYFKPLQQYFLKGRNIFLNFLTFFTNISGNCNSQAIAIFFQFDFVLFFFG